MRDVHRDRVLRGPIFEDERPLFFEPLIVPESPFIIIPLKIFTTNSLPLLAMTFHLEP